LTGQSFLILPWSRGGTVTVGSEDDAPIIDAVDLLVKS